MVEKINMGNTDEDYNHFLRLTGVPLHCTPSGEKYTFDSLKNGSLLNAASLSDLLNDHTASAMMAYSPAFAGLGEDWHYGFGLWHECQSATYNCTEGTRVSSPGAYGAYPFWDRSIGYFGIVARQGALGTFPNGVAIERAVRSKFDNYWHFELPHYNHQFVGIVERRENSWLFQNLYWCGNPEEPL